VPSRAARLFAWSGAALFCASLLYFLFTYAVTFTEIRAGRFTIGSIVVNIALFSIFALHHSLFARGPVRAWVMRHVSPRLERSVYVWIASVLFILTCADWRYVQGVAWYVEGAWAWLLHLAQVVGIVLTIRSAAIIDAFELAGIRQLTPRAMTQTDFRTAWPYGWVRHPIYAGWFLLVWPVALMTMTRLVFAATSCAYLLVAIPLEERTLRATTGGAYDAYARTVRWRLLPYVY
jgi:protein-S-isoprenylcysteine O-methyltransferase Ste14